MPNWSVELPRSAKSRVKSLGSALWTAIDRVSGPILLWKSLGFKEISVTFVILDTPCENKHAHLCQRYRSPFRTWDKNLRYTLWLMIYSQNEPGNTRARQLEDLRGFAKFAVLPSRFGDVILRFFQFCDLEHSNIALHRPAIASGHVWDSRASWMCWPYQPAKAVIWHDASCCRARALDGTRHSFTSLVNVKHRFCDIFGHAKVILPWAIAVLGEAS